MAPKLNQQPTFAQIFSLQEMIKSQNLSPEQFQGFLEHGHLVRQMLNCPDWSKIDTVAFSALFKPTLTIPWTSKDQLVSKIMDRSNLRGWGYTLADAKRLVKKLLKHDHLDDLHPTSIRLWLGGDLAFNYSEILLWVKDEVEKLGKKFKEYSDYAKCLSFLPGSEIIGEKFLDACDLDLQMFWNKTKGLVFGDIKSSCKMWPSLEVLILLALNPQVYIMMNGKTVPYLIVPGFVVDSDHLLICFFGGSEACIRGYWDDGRWRSCAFVAFRES